MPDITKEPCDKAAAVCGAHAAGAAVTEAAAEMASKDVRAFFQKRLNDLGGSDGFVSSADLDRALKMDAVFTADERRIVGALRHNVAGIEELSNDEWGDENDGITIADMDRLDALMKERPIELGRDQKASWSAVTASKVKFETSGALHQTADKIANFAAGNFDFIDTDHNDKLSRQELATAVSEGRLREEDGKVAGNILDNFETIERLFDHQLPENMHYGSDLTRYHFTALSRTFDPGRLTVPGLRGDNAVQPIFYVQPMIPGAITGGYIGSFLGPLGTAAGIGVGAGIGATIGFFGARHLENNYQEQNYHRYRTYLDMNLR